jgi:DNA-binding transcriptional LysR family regulator
VGSTRWTTVAAPAYLARHGTPQTPDDLAAHGCVRFRNTRGKVVPWTFADREALGVPGKLDLDEGALIVDAALAGIGIAQVFDRMVREHITSGRLVEVLSKHAAAGPQLFAVCLPARRRAPEIRAFLDFAAEALDAGA